MRIRIRQAALTHDKESGYVGSVQFEVEGHQVPYEITLQSDKGKEWSYSLLFLNESGSDEEIDELDEELDENDEMFNELVQAAKASLNGGAGA